MKKVRLMIDFDSTDALARFVSEGKMAAIFPAIVGVYEADSLDYTARSGGVGRKDTYILRNKSQGRKRLTITESKEV